MKTGVRGLIGGVLAGVLAMTGAPPAIADDVVTIPDTALTACITRNLANAHLTGDFTAENLSKLTNLTCSAADGVVHTLSGLDALSGLVGVYFKLDADLDLDVLAKLPRLVNVSLSVGQLSTLDLPSELHLNKLLVSTRQNQLPKTSTLTAQSIQISGDHITSLDGLGPLIADKLTVYAEQVDDVRALATSAITDLTLQVSTGGSLSGLAGVQGLQTLLLTRVPATYAGLAGQETLRSLTLYGSQLWDLETLPSLASLESLDINNYYLTGLPSFDRFPALTSLTVEAHAGLTSLGAAGSLKRLHEIDVQDAALTDISALAGATALQTVYLGWNDIKDVSALASVPARSVVDLEGNLISDLSPLAGVSPDVLDVSSNRIVDVSPLVGMSPRILDLSDNQISDITPLSGLRSSATLRLDGNRISDFSALKGWAGQLSAREQYVELPEAVVGVPYPVPVSLKGADGKDLQQLDGKVVDGFLRYQEPGWVYSTFANSGVESSATITVSLVQYAGTTPYWASPATPAPPFTSIPLPVIPDITPGHAVTATVPEWTPAATHLAYQWYTYSSSGLTAIPGATSPTFTPGTDMIGELLYFVVTGSRDGYPPTVVIAHPVSVPYLMFQPAPAMTLASSNVVRQGTVLTVAGNWGLGVWQSVVWARDGIDLPDRGLSYTTTPADAGHYIRATATIYKQGYLPTTVSADVSVVYSQFANKTPTISGTPRVGHILKAKTAWPAAALKTCKWYHYGIRIPGASQCTYKVRKSDRGKRMRVLVRVTMPGYAAMERWSRLKVVH